MTRSEGLNNNIVLIGFMGTGKTTVGKIVSSRIGYEFFDIDQEIENSAGMSIGDIFNQRGEAYFREQETKVINRILTLSNTVISCGGGIVKYKCNRDMLKKYGTVFCLKADSNSIIKRTSGTSRPLLVGKTKSEINQLIKARENLYEFADSCIDTTDKIPAEVASIIINLYNSL
jgi:shikimate kinase